MREPGRAARSAFVVVGTVGVLLALPGCESSGPESDRTVIRRDSAGIEIVENHAQAEDLTGWLGSDEPALSLGARETEGPEQFTNLGGILLLEGGGLVVMETAAAELRFFSPAGEHLRTAGGEGDGPGELRGPRGMTLLPGDTVAVWDLLKSRYEYYGIDGTHLGGVRIEPWTGRYPDVDWSTSCWSRLPLLSDASIIRCIEPPGEEASAVSDPDEGLLRATRRLAAVPRGPGSIDTLGTVLQNGVFVLDLGGGAIADFTHPFFTKPHWATGGSGRFYVADLPDYSVRAWTSDGSLERIVRRSGARRAPSPEEIEDAWTIASRTIPEEQPRRARDLAEIPDRIPAVHGLAAGPDGELWVKREPAVGLDGPAVYDVFDGTGVFVGSIRFASNVEVQVVGADRAIAVRHDELDVPFIDIFALDRMGVPTSGSDGR